MPRIDAALVQNKVSFSACGVRSTKCAEMLRASSLCSTLEPDDFTERIMMQRAGVAAGAISRHPKIIEDTNLKSHAVAEPSQTRLHQSQMAPDAFCANQPM